MPTVDPLWVPDRAEIIFINHSPAAGKEIPDMHPLLVASQKAFNERTGFVIGFPMTHAAFNAGNPFVRAVKCRAETLAPQEKSYIVGYQPKSFDWRERGAKRHAWGGGYDAELEEMLAIFDTICRPPPAVDELSSS